ncbi:MAG: ABC transporter permease [Theionarchaea archaeon]|nr:ABC transporter permease [Theionarchaea archaeon]
MMNRQRMFAFVKKDLKKMIREPATLFMLILFPVVLTLAFGLSFGAVGGDQSTVYDVGVINLDLDSSSNILWSAQFVGAMDKLEIIQVVDYGDEAAAHEDLSQGKIQALLIIPASFGKSCQSFQEAPDNPDAWMISTMDIYVDKGSLFATQAVPPLIQQVLVTLLTGDQPASTIPIIIGTPALIETQQMTMFDFMAPGLFAYAAIFLIMTVGQSFTSDRETGLLRRITTTPTTAAEFMSSQVITYMIVAILQVVVVFAMAFAVGYSPQGDVRAVLFAFLILSVFALCCVGFGLITATLARSSGAATGIAFIFILPQMFLGTFITFGLSSTAQAAGKFVPSYYVTDALTSLLLRGASVTSPSVLTDLGIVSAMSVIILFVGIFLFRKYGTA